jgi:predicted lipoprotein with Yx(FWY)xxD motif
MRKVIITLVSVALGAIGLVAGAGTALAAGGGTVITVANTPFGTGLVVGSGTYKGYSLYDITSDDAPTSYGCTTTVLTLGGQSASCTGPSGDKTAIWPAITTTGAPVAGPGVKASLLGTVTRAGVGTQITYAGHPLYMFDDAPNQVTGEGIDDPATPLPHGVWFLVKPNGNQLPWTADLTTVTLSGHHYLAVLMNTLLGWVREPVYTKAAACTGACARVWPYVLTASRAGTSGGAHSGAVGLRGTSLGTQVTYHGHPLYFYSQENLNLSTATAAGNGNRVGGFSLVRP